jgi:CubicO group peptidase (beta-lactamase class C family)
MRKAGVLRATVLLAVPIAGALWLANREPDLNRVPVAALGELVTQLEALRVRLRIPGMSATIAEGDRIVWQRGFGFANLERDVAATPDTIFPLASLTKPYGATVLLQLVEERRLDLDDPVSRYGITMDRSAPVRVRHLVSQSSGEPPGATYRYDGNAFGTLTQVIERASGQAFAKNLTERIIRPLGLTQTSPYPGDPQGFWSLVASLTVRPADVEHARADFAATGLERGPIQAALAQGYARAWGRHVWPSGLFGPMRPMPHGLTLSTTAGLVASASDVARFSIAWDHGKLLSEAARAMAWQASAGPDGRPLPYGLGWFVQDHRGERVVWHFGQAFESSSLIVKIPARQLTFVILANSDGLSRGRRLGDRADIGASPAATLFLNWSLTRSSLLR